ncbi:hypothetical protein NDU88_007708 [Pleurodeles waltl]|uniref:Uncharacterized protein n=1 Tax=Pleurodeles waltl TaxID=8319 RepID=A0AAV7QMV5_PLEWA|nr:hypothetical protein NDU88_007708 [Pleurodeles waltl]
MLPVPRFKRPPVLWQMNAEAPSWIWMVPAPAGLFRIGAVPGPFLVSSPPPFLQRIPSWQVPCDPFLPLMPVPSAPEPAVHQYTLPNGQWVLGAHSPVNLFSPSSGVDFVPVFPHVFTATVPPHTAKRWLKKRIPKCKGAPIQEPPWRTPMQEEEYTDQARTRPDLRVLGLCASLPLPEVGVACRRSYADAICFLDPVQQVVPASPPGLDLHLSSFLRSPLPLVRIATSGPAQVPGAAPVFQWILTVPMLCGSLVLLCRPAYSLASSRSCHFVSPVRFYFEAV